MSLSTGFFHGCTFQPSDDGLSRNLARLKMTTSHVGSLFLNQQKPQKLFTKIFRGVSKNCIFFPWISRCFLTILNLSNTHHRHHPSALPPEMEASGGDAFGGRGRPFKVADLTAWRGHGGSQKTWGKDFV